MKSRCSTPSERQRHVIDEGVTASAEFGGGGRGGGGGVGGVAGGGVADGGVAGGGSACAVTACVSTVPWVEAWPRDTGGRSTQPARHTNRIKLLMDEYPSKPPPQGTRTHTLTHNALARWRVILQSRCGGVTSAAVTVYPHAATTTISLRLRTCSRPRASRRRRL